MMNATKRCGSTRIACGRVARVLSDARVVAAGSILLLLLQAGPAAAQAVCRAPHSTPSLPASSERLTEAPGSGWAELTLYHQDTRDQFGAAGEREPFPGRARAVTSSVFLTAALGIVDGIDALAQVPVHRLRISGPVTGARERTGLGDARAHVRVGTRLFGVSSVPLALRAGVKVPGSRFPIDPNVLPLTEGQRDWELMVQFGHSFDTRPLYAQGWIGYRWREEDRAREHKPGDERIASLVVGGRVRELHWEFAVDGLWGRPPRSQGLVLETGRRALLQLYPRIGLPIGAGDVLVGGRLPVTGRNLPAGPAFTLGYSVGWGERTTTR